MATIVVAVLGVFIILSGWVLVDLLARRQLGERHHGCHGSPVHHRHGGVGCAGCQSLDECEHDGEAGQTGEQ